MTPAEHDAIVELAADTRTGSDRQMLVYALWRVKSERARSLIIRLLDDPDVSRHAMYSLRRAFGNDEAKRRLEPFRDHPNEDIRLAAADALKGIERSRRSPQPHAR
jgi:HEAT repeat protein